MDGSQKLPQRPLSTVRERLAQHLPIQMLALAIAGWIRHIGGRDEADRPIDVCDPFADRLRSVLADAGDDPPRRVEAVLRVDAIFGDDLPNAPDFAAAVSRAYSALVEKVCAPPSRSVQAEHSNLEPGSYRWNKAALVWCAMTSEAIYVNYFNVLRALGRFAISLRIPS